MRGVLVAAFLLVLLFLTVFSAGIVLMGSQAEEVLQIVIDQLDGPAGNDTTSRLFTVKEGDSAAVVAQKLQTEGLVKNATLFRVLVGYYGVENGLVAGDYELWPKMTMTEILAKLHGGQVSTIRLTVPEGWRVEEIAAAVEKKAIFRRGEFMDAFRQASANSDFGGMRPPQATLEGYLFPDTYKIRPSYEAMDLIAMMVRNFDVRFDETMRQEAAKRGLTIHQVVTLASIVEREAALPQERPIIASVFLNRLKKKMKLEADPTVQYALVKDHQSIAGDGYWKKNLEISDLEVSSPFNTYRNEGLPPGPISNPGLASLQAVLDPEETDYLYFVAKGDGSHVFAKTAEEHVQNVRRYMRGSP
ncbi:MAG: endolytic transglycosylase MltG [Chloroflexi bacterium]|nr:endolytic transglycosylase MltG [Chloroflexota bacterium]